MQVKLCHIRYSCDKQQQADKSVTLLVNFDAVLHGDEPNVAMMLCHATEKARGCSTGKPCISNRNLLCSNSQASVVIEISS